MLSCVMANNLPAYLVEVVAAVVLMRFKRRFALLMMMTADTGSAESNTYCVDDYHFPVVGIPWLASLTSLNHFELFLSNFLSAL